MTGLKTGVLGLPLFAVAVWWSAQADAQVTAVARAGATPPRNKGLQPVNAESDANAMVCASTISWVSRSFRIFATAGMSTIARTTFARPSCARKRQTLRPMNPVSAPMR